MARERGLQVGDQGLVVLGIEVPSQRERAVTDLEGGRGSSVELAGSSSE
jgi:hypothetical protein